MFPLLEKNVWAQEEYTTRNTGFSSLTTYHIEKVASGKMCNSNTNKLISYNLVLLEMAMDQSQIYSPLYLYTDLTH